MVLKPRSSEPILLTDNISLRTLPTCHLVFGQHTGVGLDFEIPARRRHLVITGDTAWNQIVRKAYLRFRGCDVVLVAHVSSARPEEVVNTLTEPREKFYDKHLCVHGLCKIIETVRPQQLVLSEIGEELAGVVGELATLTERVYGVPTRIGNLTAGTVYL